MVSIESVSNTTFIQPLSLIRDKPRYMHPSLFLDYKHLIDVTYQHSFYAKLIRDEYGFTTLSSVLKRVKQD